MTINSSQTEIRDDNRCRPTGKNCCCCFRTNKWINTVSSVWDKLSLFILYEPCNHRTSDDEFENNNIFRGFNETVTYEWNQYYVLILRKVSVFRFIKRKAWMNVGLVRFLKQHNLLVTSATTTINLLCYLFYESFYGVTISRTK